VVAEALKEDGFEIVQLKDQVDELDSEPGGTPWYEPLEGSWYNPKRIQHSPTGQFVIGNILTALEAIGAAPKGTKKVSDMLNLAVEGLVGAGRQRVFTPMYLFVCRKPAAK